MPSPFPSITSSDLHTSLGSRLSYPHFTNEESKPQRLKDFPTVIKLAEVFGLDSFLV